MPQNTPAVELYCMLMKSPVVWVVSLSQPVPLLLQTVQVPVYSEQEYQMYLHDDAWTKAETDHLFDLSRRFDLRFVVIHDRYDHQQFKVSNKYVPCFLV